MLIIHRWKNGYNAFSSIDFPYLAVIQDGNIMRYIPPVPYEDEVFFYENLDENVYLIKMIPGIKPRILRSVFENYDCIIVESFGVGGIPKSISDDFYKLCQEFPDRLVVMSTLFLHFHQKSLLNTDKSYLFEGS